MHHACAESDFQSSECLAEVPGQSALQPCDQYCHAKTTLSDAETGWQTTQTYICNRTLLETGCPGAWCKCGSSMAEDCNSTVIFGRECSDGDSATVTLGAALVVAAILA